MTLTKEGHHDADTDVLSKAAQERRPYESGVAELRETYGNHAICSATERDKEEISQCAEAYVNEDMYDVTVQVKGDGGKDSHP